MPRPRKGDEITGLRKHTSLGDSDTYDDTQGKKITESTAKGKTVRGWRADAQPDSDVAQLRGVSREFMGAQSVAERDLWRQKKRDRPLALRSDDIDSEVGEIPECGVAAAGRANPETWAGPTISRRRFGSCESEGGTAQFGEKATGTKIQNERRS